MGGNPPSFRDSLVYIIRIIGNKDIGKSGEACLTNVTDYRIITLLELNDEPILLYCT